MSSQFITISLNVWKNYEDRKIKTWPQGVHSLGKKKTHQFMYYIYSLDKKIIPFRYDLGIINTKMLIN